MSHSAILPDNTLSYCSGISVTYQDAMIFYYTTVKVALNWTAEPALMNILFYASCKVRKFEEGKQWSRSMSVT